MYVGRRKKVDDDDGDDDLMTDQGSGGSNTSVNAGGTIATQSMMTCAALDILSSLCDHARDGRRDGNAALTTCASIEGDMIGSIGPYLLDALADNMRNFFFRHNCIKDGQMRTDIATNSAALHGLLEFFKSCSVIFCLSFQLLY